VPSDDPATIDGMPGFLRDAGQLTGLMILAGSGGGGIGILRQQYGCGPEAMTVVREQAVAFWRLDDGRTAFCGRAAALGTSRQGF